MEIIKTQIFELFLLSIPIACVAWTITHEEIFKEPREYCLGRCKDSKTIVERKFFYLFTCEYCFSHYVTIFFIFFTDYRLLILDWRGYVIVLFSLVWIANVYMSLFALIHQDVKKEKTKIELMKQQSK